MGSGVWGFFYGGLINPEVMRRVGFRPSREIPAWLPGFDLRISPLVNVVQSPGATVFGVLMETTHAELVHVYGQLQAAYLPLPVVAHTMEASLVPALCYIVPDMAPGQAEAGHIAPLLISAEKLAFPDWYVAKIRSFLPAGTR